MKYYLIYFPNKYRERYVYILTFLKTIFDAIPAYRILFRSKKKFNLIVLYIFTITIYNSCVLVS